MLNTLHKHTLTPISDDGDADNHAFVEKSFCFSCRATQVLLSLFFTFGLTLSEHFTFYHLKYHQEETYNTIIFSHTSPG